MIRDSIIALMVTVTVYNPTPSQTDDTPLITADGSYIDTNNIQNWIAVSKDVEEYFPMGSKVELCGVDSLDGEYIVRDRMNSRHRKRVDILRLKQKLGKWTNVRITKS